MILSQKSAYDLSKINKVTVLFCTTMWDHAMTGAGRFAQSMSKLSDIDSNIQLHILSEDVHDEPMERKYRVHLSSAASTRFLDYWYKSRDYARAIAAVMSSHEIDIVFFNDAWIGYHWMNTASKTPVVVSVRDDNALRFWSNSIGGIPGFAIRRKMERKVTRHAARVITNSGFMASALLEQYDISNERIHVVHPAYTNYLALAFSILPIHHDEPIRILFVKNDFRRGGLELLINTLNELKQYEFIVTVVGPTSQNITSRIPVLRQMQHVKFHLVGREYNHQQVLGLMKEHHIFCVPSKREAFGVSNIEALASGMRVVFHPVGGIPAKLKEYAFAMDRRSIASCKKSLLEAIQCESDVLLARISAGREWIEESFSTDRMMAEVKTLLCNLHQTSNPNSRTD